MATILFVLQVVSALIFIILMAVQTDKNEQSGVMGLGAQGGRMSGSIDMPVGAERILKPMSKWTGIGFLFASLLAAANSELVAAGSGLAWYYVVAAIVVYIVAMMFSDKLWSAFLRIFGANQ